MSIICQVEKLLQRVAELCLPLIDFVARLYIAEVFFTSGLNKISNWQSTLYLFEHEYVVPLLPSSFAAYLGTGAELVLPVLILLGLGGRFFILALFIFNIVATISYEFLWSVEGQVGLTDHLQWGIILLLLFGYGYGKLSVDHWIKTKFCHSNDEE